jgi:hypothetical protein
VLANTLEIIVLLISYSVSYFVIIHTHKKATGEILILYILTFVFLIIVLAHERLQNKSYQAFSQLFCSVPFKCNLDMSLSFPDISLSPRYQCLKYRSLYYDFGLVIHCARRSPLCIELISLPFPFAYFHIP